MIGLDASADMVFRARENYDDVQLARMEDPLPEGPWDLVIGVLSIHHLRAEQKQNLFRQVREQARSFVIGDVVKADVQIAPIDAGYDFPETAADLAEWCGGEVAWEADDLAVVRRGLLRARAPPQRPSRELRRLAGARAQEPLEAATRYPLPSRDRWPSRRRELPAPGATSGARSTRPARRR